MQKNLDCGWYETTEQPPGCHNKPFLFLFLDIPWLHLARVSGQAHVQASANLSLITANWVSADDDRVLVGLPDT